MSRVIRVSFNHRLCCFAEGPCFIEERITKSYHVIARPFVVYHPDPVSHLASYAPSTTPTRGPAQSPSTAVSDAEPNPKDETDGSNAGMRLGAATRTQKF